MKAKEIVGNVLIREIISIRVDTLWKMIELQKEGRMPGKDTEGATGDFDNKGAIFVPGSLIFDDSDRKPIAKTKYGKMSGREFGKRIREAMQVDNATLLFQDGLAQGVNLDNGFFADVASNLLANKQAAVKRRRILERSPARKIYSDEITKSYTPPFVEPPYGARTKLSSCISVCLTEPRMYHIACRKEFGLRDEKEELRFWNGIRESTKPIQGRGGETLASSQVVVCHTTRYHEKNLVGLTRILGFGKFGEFATFTLEKLNRGLLSEAGLTKASKTEHLLFAKSEGLEIAGVLRIYTPTKPGKRQKKTETLLLSPTEDLGVSVVKLTREAKKRYQL